MNPNGGDDTLGSTQPTPTRGRIILFPLPIQGHITPMLQLGNILHNHGFKIVFIHARPNSPSFPNYAHFTFKTIDDHAFEMKSVPTTPPDPALILTHVNENIGDSFTDCLNGLLAEPNEPPVACLIADAEFYFTQAVADSMKIPRFVTWACMIASLPIYGDLQFFYEKGYFNFTKKDQEYEARMPKYPLLKVKDIIKITKNPKGAGEYHAKVAQQIKASSGIIWGSFTELDEPTLEALNQEYPVPKFRLGPLHMYFPVLASSVLDQDRTFFTWLDGKAPKSVIYISFGSVARLSKLEFLELAYALLNIDFSFLWVVRPGLVDGSESSIESLLPDKFLDQVGDRGRIVKWCPQDEVLAHPSIGCFWTHGGWNSTLECVFVGIPMICSPCFTGQAIVARYISEAWKIGVYLEDDLERDGIERVIKRVMEGKEGEEIRERINRVKKETADSFDEGGSSHQSLNKLIDYISSFSLN